MRHPLAFVLMLGLLLGPSCPADTPETIAEPDVLRLSVPRLKEQHTWTEYATPDQIRLFDGPQTVWPSVSEKDYDLGGFDAGALGSKVPPPGVHPRILFSPGDVPAIARRIQETRSGRRALDTTEKALSRTIWDPKSDEGKIFAKLSAGDLAGLEWPDSEGKTLNLGNEHFFKGYKKSMKSSAHEGYLPHLMASAAFYCLLKNDEARGRQVAAAFANYYKLREPLIDRLNNEFDAQKLTPNDEWRPMHNMVANSNLGFGYDCAAAWMIDEQKAVMQRVISKATKGKRAYGMNGPLRWRDTNWVGWDLQLFLTSLAIEGEPGYDPDILPVARDTARAYLDWGINEYGTIFETNGKNGAGLQNELLSLVALARRGDNLFGHPHLRKLTSMQAQSVVPAGGWNVNNGTWGNAIFWGDLASALKMFYPGDRCADWLLRQAIPDLDAPGDSSPPLDGVGLLTLQDLFSKQDWAGEKAADGRLKEAWERDGLGLPLAASDPVHGLLLARSGNDKDALFLMFEARPDLRGVGHQHHDSGHFYLAALGEMWAVEAGAKNSYSPDHNTILIDGRGHADASSAPRVKFLGAAVEDSAAIASADLQNAYDYGWTCPMHFSWLSDDNKNGLWKLGPDTDPDLVAYYRGTQNAKMRLWGASYWDNNWGPVMRIEGNPVDHAFRSAGIVRGKHPYALVVDDLSKDGREHLYEWLMQVPDNVRMGGLSMPKGSVPAVMLHKMPGGDTWRMRGPEKLPDGTPALLVCLLDAKSETPAEARNVVVSADLPYRLEQQSAAAAQPEQTLAKNRMVISRRAVDPHFKVALVPFRVGEKLPCITWDSASGRATLQWPDQTDTIDFIENETPTRFAISRDGKPVAASPKSPG
jgi:hypothetical protein